MLANPPPLLTNLPQGGVWSGPTSPALSSWSWLADDTPRPELMRMLRSARASLREKEKDLTLAAEIGHHLLRSNHELQDQYDALCLQQQDEVSRAHAARRQQQLVDQLQESNMELQRHLCDAQTETQQLERQYDRRARELQHDIELLQGHLGMAMQKMAELEEQQQEQHQVHDHAWPWRHGQQQQQEQQAYRRRRASLAREQMWRMDELASLERRMASLQAENTQLKHSKRVMQQRLNDAVQYVGEMQAQSQQHSQYQDLAAAYEVQARHVAQLHQALEDHRCELQHWQEKQELAQGQQHLLWDSPNGNENDHFGINNHEIMPSLFSNVPSLTSASSVASITHVAPEMPNLMAELAMANEKHNEIQKSSSSPPPLPLSIDYALFSPSAKNPAENNNNKINKVNLAPPAATLPPTSRDHVDAPHDFGPLDTTLVLTPYHLYPSPHKVVINLSNGTTNSLKPSLSVVQRVQRWCRFAIVVTMAMIINVVEGPDAMLHD
ncbi:hypothetical protein BC940DRAFT_302753 [Gongronella butleri]|nr:hypothetical protein BC940DRAFT_302753 [Gongronella butleri]